MYINTVVVRLSLFVYRLSKTVVKVVEEQPLTDNLRKVEGRRQKVKCETCIGGRTLGVVMYCAAPRRSRSHLPLSPLNYKL